MEDAQGKTSSFQAKMPSSAKNRSKQKERAGEGQLWGGDQEEYDYQVGGFSTDELLTL